MREIAKKKIINNYLDSNPRHYRAENIIKNKQNIENLCNNYTNTQEGKKLNILSNMTFESILVNLVNHYLKDNKCFKNGFNGGIYELEEFNTFEQDYANEDEKYKSNLKQKALELNTQRPRK